MKLLTRNFGEIEYSEDHVITFAEGIPGFKDLKKYIFIQDSESAFEYMQNVEDGNISFIVINPYLLKKDYSINIKDQYIEALGGGTEKDFSIYVIATIIDNIENATVNLLAPVLIQHETKRGMQVILENTAYTTKHKIVDLIEGGC